MAGRASTPSTSAPGGAAIQATPSYGVWAISPTTQLAAWGVGGTRGSAQKTAAANCEKAGGVSGECSVFAGWAKNGYSAIVRGANGTWSISVAWTPAGAEATAKHVCQTVKASGLACTLKGTGATADPWASTPADVGWIDQPGILSAKPSSGFFCVTGPGGNCVQPGAGVPAPANWAVTPTAWPTSPVTGGCTLDFIGLVVPVPQAVDMLEAIGGLVHFDAATGNWSVLFTAAMPFHNCAQLAAYIAKHQTQPGAARGRDAGGGASGSGASGSAAVSAKAPVTFVPIPKSQLKSVAKQPLLRKAIGRATVQLGALAEVVRLFPALWPAGTARSLTCTVKSGTFRCQWNFRAKGKAHAGYLLIKQTGNRYALQKVVRTKG